MKIFIIILMFITTVYAINEIKEKGSGEKGISALHYTDTKLSNAGCYAIAIVTAVYDIVSLFLLVKVV